MRFQGAGVVDEQRFGGGHVGVGDVGGAVGEDPGVGVADLAGLQGLPGGGQSPVEGAGDRDEVGGLPGADPAVVAQPGGGAAGAGGGRGPEPVEDRDPAQPFGLQPFDVGAQFHDAVAQGRTAERVQVFGGEFVDRRLQVPHARPPRSARTLVRILSEEPPPTSDNSTTPAWGTSRWGPRGKDLTKRCLERCAPSWTGLVLGLA